MLLKSVAGNTRPSYKSLLFEPWFSQQALQFLPWRTQTYLLQCSNVGISNEWKPRLYKMWKGHWLDRLKYSNVSHLKSTDTKILCCISYFTATGTFSPLAWKLWIATIDSRSFFKFLQLAFCFIETSTLPLPWWQNLWHHCFGRWCLSSWVEITGNFTHVFTARFY